MTEDSQGELDQFLEGKFPEPLCEEMPKDLSEQHVERIAVDSVKRVRKFADELLPRLPEKYRAWIAMLVTVETESAVKRGDAPDSVSQFDLCAEWIVQQALFRAMTRHFKMPLIQTMVPGPNAGEAAMILTRSSSFLTLDRPINESGHRLVRYARIPSRRGSWTGASTSLNKPVLVAQGRNVTFADNWYTAPAEQIAIVPEGSTGDFAEMASMTETGLRSVTGHFGIAPIMAPRSAPMSAPKSTPEIAPKSSEEQE